MATLDDKLLGEKKHYYCSSSEDENDDDPDSGKTDGCEKQQESAAAASASCPADDWQGYSSNVSRSDRFYVILILHSITDWTERRDP